MDRKATTSAVSKTDAPLISWEEVKAEEDVYQAVTLANGRPALIKGRSGEACWSMCKE